jgi:Na+-transporting methylmalonyl-CoA/oxaloacetate decarboxylase gamma subunit
MMLAGITVLEIIGIVVAVLALLAFVMFWLGLFANDRWRRRTAAAAVRNATQADHDLAAAGAKDRGWDRAILEAAVRDAWAARPGAAPIDEITLLVVIDPPGTDSDRAEFEVRAGGTSSAVYLARTGDSWAETDQPSDSSPPEA